MEFILYRAKARPSEGSGLANPRMGIQDLRECSCPEIAEKIMALERTAWPAAGEPEEFPSAPNTYVSSLVLLKDQTAVCHVGIRKSALLHRGRRYLAYGLSEVVTDPRYQNQGLASRLISRAARFMMEQEPDIGIFTCEPKRVPLYQRGGFEPVKGACFVGGTGEHPFRSDRLGLVTLVRFFSPAADLHRADFEDTDIVFDLGEGQLW